MKIFSKSILISAVLFASLTNLKAQLYVQTAYYVPALSIDSLINTFFNDVCVSISNITHQGDEQMFGFFEGSQSEVGLNAGIVLSTGGAASAIGPNFTSYNSGIYTASNDEALETMLGLPYFYTYDACFVEFDMVPDSGVTSVSFKYVYGSEEYTGNVGTPFADIFAIFISGPGFTGQQNIATVPGTSDWVSINSINSTSNSNLFIDNYLGSNTNNDPGDLEYNGFTVPLTATAAVVPGQTYHIKIVVTDVYNAGLESGVLLSVESLCQGDSVPPTGGYTHTQPDGNNTVVFSSEAIFAPNVIWNFGDGNTSIETNPEHTYAQAGTYTVTMTATNYSGSEVTQKIIHVGCTAPTNDLVEHFAPDKIHVIWPKQQSATSYRLRYRANGATAWVTNSSIQPFQLLSNLIPNNFYQYQIQSKCSGVWTPWSSLKTLQSGGGSATCSPPTLVTTVPLSPTSQRVFWNYATGAASYQVQYRAVGVTAWTNRNSNTAAVTISGLLPNTTYEYRVRTKCGTAFTGFSPIAVFQTATLAQRQPDERAAELIDVADVAWSVSPNPVSDRFTIHLPAEVIATEVRILDIAGRTVLNAAFPKDGLLSVGRIPTGLYFLQVQANAGLLVQKIVLQ